MNSSFLRWFRGIKGLHLTTINHNFCQIQFLTLRGLPIFSNALSNANIQFWDFSFFRCDLFLWVPMEPIWVKLIFSFFAFSAHPNMYNCTSDPKVPWNLTINKTFFLSSWIFYWDEISLYSNKLANLVHRMWEKRWDCRNI